jgi:DNA-binding response OmpR family regulator
MKKNLRILVTDCDQEFLNIATRKLSLRDFIVLTALSAETAISILKAEKIDAIVLNFSNANKNGVMILDYINSLEKKPILLPLSNDGFEFFETHSA